MENAHGINEQRAPPLSLSTQKVISYVEAAIHRYSSYSENVS